MVGVTKIEWTFHTSGAAGSGTDSRVSILMLRDARPLINVNAEPGETTRLDRGSYTTLYWEFKDPRGIGTAVSGEAVPYTVDFPNGVSNHLLVLFTIHSDDAWRIGTIESRVFSGKMTFPRENSDAWEWEETIDYWTFQGEDVLSTNQDEGTTSLSLWY